MATLADREVLVLNKGWTAVKITTLEKAMPKLTGDYHDGKKILPKASIISFDNGAFQEHTWEEWEQLRPIDGEDVMRSPSKILRVPEIIKLNRFSHDRIKKKKTKYNRNTIFRRDNFTCQYCGIKPKVSELSIDHVVPKGQGGLTIWENTILACVDCNAKKACRTPQQANMKLLSIPKKPKNDEFIIAPGRVKESWRNFLDESYWNVELENDNED